MQVGYGESKEKKLRSDSAVLSSLRTLLTFFLCLNHTGNQTPQTFGGVMMVFSLGFFSILAFGAVLASAGYIVSRIFDDAVNRRKLTFLSLPWVSCLVWGSAYYSWMALIAFYTEVWKKKRLNDESFTMNDGYWFR
jgi:hypothetical protein